MECKEWGRVTWVDRGPPLISRQNLRQKYFRQSQKKVDMAINSEKKLRKKKKREFVFQIFETAHNHSGTKFTPHEDEFLGPHNSSELTQIKNWREGLAFQFPTSIFRFKQLPHGLHYFCFEVWRRLPSSPALFIQASPKNKLSNSLVD